MVRFNVLIFNLLFVFSSGFCQEEVLAIDDLSKIPVVTEEDKAFANVFKALDGKWKGKFKIYEVQSRVRNNPFDLYNITLEEFNTPNFKLVNEISVEQVYTSESPYFQRVTITDIYVEGIPGIVSEGVNKIQDGEMWCVVKKPSETVIHKGILEGEHTIIWTREQKDPNRKEFFKETVEGDVYQILGWGYYDDDDLNITPRLWFHGEYRRY